MAGSEPDRGLLHPPERFRRPWLRSQRPIARHLARPLESFLQTEIGSGSLLLAAAIAALIWANVSLDGYEAFWHNELNIDLGSLSFSEDLRHVVNDGLMALFFFVVSLEVKRELLFGSLRDRRSAAVPVATAIGTMVGASLVFVAINLDGGQLDGWAIPMATDIAFALAALGIAGRRAPPQLRAFLLTVAVVDDLATIAVIALVFGKDISVAWLLGGLALVIAIYVLQRLAVRKLAIYVILGGLLWLATFESGLHATIAGVVLGFMTPARPFYPREATGRLIGSRLQEITGDADVELGAATMREAARLANEAVSPLVRMEWAVHPWSAYLVLPLFALANAGVAISASEIADTVTSPLGLGILCGLVVGKPLGGILVAWASVRLGGRLPEGLDRGNVASAAPLMGIGFTVAIFIATLAFDDAATVDRAKLAILIGSVVAGLAGLVALAARRGRDRGDADPSLPSTGTASSAR